MNVRVDYDALGGMLKLTSWGVQLSNGFRIYIDGGMHAYSIAVIQTLILDVNKQIAGVKKAADWLQATPAPNNLYHIACLHHITCLRRIICLTASPASTELPASVASPASTASLAPTALPASTAPPASTASPASTLWYKSYYVGELTALGFGAEGS